MEQQLEAVYESVLVHLPAQELHRSCNGVLQEEFASVVATVDHLVEAFAKLEEVYDAVSRLQRGHKSTGGCSASLMEATARLIALQQELEQRVAALARQMAVERLSERKRKREEAVGGPQPSPKVQAKVADMNVSEANGRCEFSSKNASEASVSSKSDGDSGDDKDKGDTEATMMKKVAEQNALAAVSKIRNEAISTDASATTGGSRATSTGYSATALKIIVDDVNQLSHEDRAFVVPDVVTALKQSVEDDIEMTQASAVAGSLDVMIQWWARKCESQVRHLQVYREYAAALKAYVARLPPSKPKMHIERQLDALTSSVNAARSVRKQSAVNTRAQSPPTFNFSKLAGALERQPFAKRQTHLVWLLVAFKKDTISRINDKGERRVLKPMSKPHNKLQVEFAVLLQISPLLDCWTGCLLPLRVRQAVKRTSSWMTFTTRRRMYSTA
ncbi:hypothetical protein V7S43_001856 [Phytophthora oleae]|uniref:Uncharacterized protein n=1 Tax=Phytophthora oleae TaxID=2107226 RepID=A0ABD3G1N7_9STRA